MKPVVFHVDVNSAYLAWSALHGLSRGAEVDLRTIPSIVGGDPENRHGIVLAKSGPAKEYGIVTAETLFSALAKCPSLVIVPPNFKIYSKASEALTELLSRHTPILERYSIDECFLEMGEISREEALALAHRIRNEVRTELGFTVNVGVGLNKLSAKMASDFKKPDMVHTLYPDEVCDKLHPLPVEELFMVGPALAEKLRNINIRTIGDLARCDREYLAQQFGKMGRLIWNFAWGKDSSRVNPEGTVEIKGMGNSTTLPRDLTQRADCHRTILSLLETTVGRLKEAGFHTTCIAVHYTTMDFKTRRRQKQLANQTDSIQFIYEVSCQLFDEIWLGQPVRKIGVSFTRLRTNQVVQLSMMDLAEVQKEERLNDAVSKIRHRFGDSSLVRASFVDSEIRPFSGGIDDQDF